MKQGIFDQLKVFFQKQGELDKSWQPFLINRFLSFDRDSFGLSCKLDKYTFFVQKDILYYVLMTSIPPRKAPFIRYIRKPAKDKKQMEDLLSNLQGYYKWTDNELKKNTPTLLRLFNNKKYLKKVMEFCGSSIKELKKAGFEIEEPIDAERSLKKWFK